jgi:hypothetical protein
MDARRQVLGKDAVDDPMPRNAAFSCKLRCDDSHAEMALARGVGASMASMEMRLVDNLQSLWPQFRH